MSAHETASLRLLTCWILGGILLVTAATGSAQFNTLLPEIDSDSAKRVRANQVRFDSLRESVALSARSVCRNMLAAQRETCVSGISADDSVFAILRREVIIERKAWCASILSATLADTTKAPPSDTVAWRRECERAMDVEKAVRRKAGQFWETSLFLPLSQRRLGRLYGGGLRVLSAFTANISEKEVLILSDVISGAIGVFPFGITHATVVSAADSQANLSADTVRRATVNVLQLMSNGGSLTARLQYPLLAFGGVNVKHSASVYVQTGLLGPLGRPEAVQGSGAAVAEYLLGLSIREPDSTASLLGELVVGGRLGYATTFTGVIVPGVDTDRGFGFFQLGIGLQGSGALRLSVLLNHVTSRASEAFVPGLILNLSALGLAKPR